MPELAEVEYFRRCWDSGLGQKVLNLHLHGQKRIFRGNDLEMLQRTLTGARLLSSEARGKQLVFRFSNRGWLGIHLGMTGALRREAARFIPGKHDHLVLRQRGQALVFSDPRQFGRVLFHHGLEPEWWTRLPAGLLSPTFTFERMRGFLARYRRTPIKAVLLRQEGFPGIGNWMADEILWRAKLHPALPTGRLTAGQQRLLWRTVQFVCKGALRIVSKDYSDPPPSWLFRHRWKKGGRCPKDQQMLQRTVVGGRTTVFCPKCQGIKAEIRDPRSEGSPKPRMSGKRSGVGAEPAARHNQI
jgi:formamidopyrimidine-DNA glycosylase